MIGFLGKLFSSKKLLVNAKEVNGSQVQIAGNNIINNFYGDKANCGNFYDREYKLALKNILNDNANNCQRALCEKELSSVDNLIQVLKSTDYASCETSLKERFKFYELISELMSGKENDSYCDLLFNLLKNSHYSNDVLFLRKISTENYIPSLDELIHYCHEVQACAFDVMFRNSKWEVIVELYNEVNSSSNTLIKKDFSSIPYFWLYYSAHSFFNLGKYSCAFELYKKLDDDASYNNKLRRYEIKSMRCAAETMISISLYNDSNSEPLSILTNNLLNIIKKFQEQDSIPKELSSLLWSVLMLSYIYRRDDGFLSIYDEIPENIKQLLPLKIMKGYYLESIGEYKKAYDFYSCLDWKNSEQVFIRCMVCRLMLKEYNQIISDTDSVFINSSISHITKVSFRLAALAEVHPINFLSEFECEWSKDSLNVEDRIKLVICLNCKDQDHIKLFQSLVLPWIVDLIKKMLFWIYIQELVLRLYY